jgi:hypothetical protein
MSESDFLSTDHLRKIASAKAGEVVPDEDADTLPVPIWQGDRMLVLIMYCPVRGRPGHRSMLPPHYALHLDPRSGAIVRAWKATPRELGITDPTQRIAGIAPPGSATWETLLKDRERLLAMSNRIWSAFANRARPRDSRLRPELITYWRLFQEIATPEEAPFYLQAAPDFFNWVRAAL